MLKHRLDPKLRVLCCSLLVGLLAAPMPADAQGAPPAPQVTIASPLAQKITEWLAGQVGGNVSAPQPGPKPVRPATLPEPATPENLAAMPAGE